jgi:hypothetical protein
MIKLLVGELDTLKSLVRVFPLPRDYLVVDIETSGFSKNNDLIVAASWGNVKDDKPGDAGYVILNWFKTLCVDHERLRAQLMRIEREFAKNGRQWHYPASRLEAEGIDPFQGLNQLIRVLHNAMASRLKIVGHNICAFDGPFIDQAIERFIPNYTLPCPDDGLYDTALIEKAMITGKAPWAGESLADWQQRVSGVFVKRGQTYSLSNHCVPKYQLAERFGLDMLAAHRPEMDTLMTHHLFETYRVLAEAPNG